MRFAPRLIPAVALTFALNPTIRAEEQSIDPELLTIAESSGFKATATHAEVMDLLRRIDEVDNAGENVMHLTEFGRTFEGREMPLAIIAEPPVRTPGEAVECGKPIVFAFGDIHAGEVCGKEALLMLARELVTTPDHPLLDDLVILIAPIYNADGNDRMSKDNRPGQAGPEEGMGQRRNAQNLDLNRDWVKLEAPESRAMVKLLSDWDPHIVIDTHTTNGSHHRNSLTFAGPSNPSCHRETLEFTRDELLATVSERLLERTGYLTFSYGNFNRDQTIWATYGCDPRFSTPYCGLRGCMAILSEAHSYKPYEERIVVTREFVREIMAYAAENKQRVMEIHDQARFQTIGKGRNPQPDDCVGIRHKLAAFMRPATVHGYEMIPRERGRPRPSDVPKDYTVIHLGRFEPTLSVRRPYAYIIPPGFDNIVDKLQQHGIKVEPFEGAATVESYTITEIERAEREFQGHRRLTLEVEADQHTETFPAGSSIVRTGQRLGTLIVYMLEPQSVDGLATWNFFDDHLELGGEFPVMRIGHRSDIK